MRQSHCGTASKMPEAAVEVPPTVVSSSVSDSVVKNKHTYSKTAPQTGSCIELPACSHIDLMVRGSVKILAFPSELQGSTTGKVGALWVPTHNQSRQHRKALSDQELRGCPEPALPKAEVRRIVLNDCIELGVIRCHAEAMLNILVQHAGCRI